MLRETFLGQRWMTMTSAAVEIVFKPRVGYLWSAAASTTRPGDGDWHVPTGEVLMRSSGGPTLAFTSKAWTPCPFSLPDIDMRVLAGTNHIFPIRCIRGCYLAACVTKTCHQAKRNKIYKMSNYICSFEYLNQLMLPIKTYKDMALIRSCPHEIHEENTCPNRFNTEIL